MEEHRLENRLQRALISAHDHTSEFMHVHVLQFAVHYLPGNTHMSGYGAHLSQTVQVLTTKCVLTSTILRVHCGLRQVVTGVVLCKLS